MRSRSQMPVDGATSAVSVVISAAIAFVAIIVGITALVQMRKDHSSGKGWAIAGICLGVFQLLVFLATFLAVESGR